MGLVTALKRMVSGQKPLASDVNQLIDGLTGAADVGPLSMFAQLPTPSAPTVAINTTAGVLNGACQYIQVNVTGWKGTDGSFYVAGFAPSAVSGTVNPANQQVNVTMTVGPTGTIGRILYRTTAGGTTFKFLAWFGDNSTTAYTDNVSDANLGMGMPTVNGNSVPSTAPTGNSTGTSIAGINALAHGPSLTALLHFESDVTTTRGLRGTFTRSSSAVNPSTFATVPNNAPRFVPGKFGNAIFIEEGTTNLVSNPDFETVNTTAQVFNDALTSYTGSTVPAPWTLQSGSFTFGASGATTGAANSTITAGNKAWCALSGQTLTAQATFVANTAGSSARLFLYVDGQNYYNCAFNVNSSVFNLYKYVNGSSSTLKTSSATLATGTSYTVTLSVDASGNLTSKLYQGTDTTGTLLQTLTATDTSLTGGFLIGVGGDTGVIVSNAKVTAPWVASWTIFGDSRVAWAVTKNAIAGTYSVCAVGFTGCNESQVKQTISVAANTSYTFSGYLNGLGIGTTNGAKVNVNWQNGATYISTSFGSKYTGTLSTQRTTTNATSPLNATTAVLILSVYDSGTVTFDDIQLEQKSYATSFVNGTRNAETLTLPSSVLNASAGTISCWAYEDGNSHPKQIIDTTSNILRLYRNGSNQYQMVVGGVNVFATAPSVGIHLLTVCWNGLSVSLYIDGVKVGTGTLSSSLSLSGVTTLYIGCSSTGAYQWNNWIDDFAIWNRALSDSEIYSISAATQPIIDAHATPIVPDVHSYSQYASNPDNYDIYQTVQQKRRDGTLYMQSTLSNPDANGNYQTLTVNYYDATGAVVVNTQTWTLSYDSYARIVSKVLN